jgi:hypothetical protein
VVSRVPGWSSQPDPNPEITGDHRKPAHSLRRYTGSALAGGLATACYTTAWGTTIAKFLGSVVAQPKVKRLLSSDHFSVDGTLLEAWASIKSFRRKDGGDNDSSGPGRNAERNFHKEKRSNETHRSTTDPEARLYKKGDGQPAKLCYMGHALMENRHGLVVGGGASLATGTAEREAALALIDQRRGRRRITLGADKPMTWLPL